MSEISVKKQLDGWDFTLIYDHSEYRFYLTQDQTTQLMDEIERVTNDFKKA